MIYSIIYFIRQFVKTFNQIFMSNLIMFCIKVIYVIKLTYKKYIINDNMKFRIIKIIFVNKVILKTIFRENVFEYI